MKNTKKSLVVSIVTLLLCTCMFVGSTFAWFTDTVSNTGNKIQAGTLDIALYEDVYKENGDFDSLNEIKDGSPAIFNYDKWEPGYTDYHGFTIENKGNLALKFKLDIISNTPSTETTKLEDVIDVYVKVLEEGDSTSKPASFDSVKADEKFVKVGTLSTLLDSADPDGSIWGIILADGQSIDDINNPAHKKIAKTGVETLQLVLHMQEEAGNEYQGLSVGDGFAVNLYATQYTFEKDGFGSEQYDAQAEYPHPIIASPEDVNELLHDLKSGDTLLLSAQEGATEDNPTKFEVIDLANAITSGKTLKDVTITADKNVAVDRISILTENSERTEPAKIDNLTIKNIDFALDSGTTQIGIIDIKLNENDEVGTIIIDDCVLAGKLGKSTSNTAINFMGATNANIKELIFDGCVFEDIGYVLYCNNSGIATTPEVIKFTNCKFKNISGWPVQMYLKTTKTFELSNCEFVDCVNLGGVGVAKFNNGGLGSLENLIIKNNKFTNSKGNDGNETKYFDVNLGCKTVDLSGNLTRNTALEEFAELTFGVDYSGSTDPGKNATNKGLRYYIIAE